MSPLLPPIIGAHIDAVNAHDTDAIVGTFAPDAIVIDNRREIRGTAAGDEGEPEEE